jgi:hypothetical protein
MANKAFLDLVRTEPRVLKENLAPREIKEFKEETDRRVFKAFKVDKAFKAIMVIREFKVFREETVHKANKVFKVDKAYLVLALTVPRVYKVFKGVKVYKVLVEVVATLTIYRDLLV